MDVVCEPPAPHPNSPKVVTLTTSLLGICPQAPPSGTRPVDKQPEPKTKTRLVEFTVFSAVSSPHPCDCRAVKEDAEQLPQAVGQV